MSGIYQSPTPPGEGAWGLVPLSNASDSSAAKICQRGGGGQSEGAEQPSREGLGGRFFLKFRV